MSKSITAEEILPIFHEGESKFYNAGLNGEAFAMFPNLTADTTAEEERQMINNEIDEFCIDHGESNPAPNLKVAMYFMIEVFVSSYREGLNQREKLKKESA